MWSLPTDTQQQIGRMAQSCVGEVWVGHQKNLFSERVFRHWDSLPGNEVGAPCLQCSKGIWVMIFMTGLSEVQP